MNNIDAKLAKFASLPLSFEAVLNDIVANDQSQSDLIKYMNYLPDDSVIPDTVSAVFKPANMTLSLSWDAVPAYYKLTFFKKGVHDHSTHPGMLDRYHENDFDRIRELHRDPNSALRLQLKDEIVKELVRAYMEGVAAAQQANTAQDLSDRNVRLEHLVDEYKKNGCINARVKQRLFKPNNEKPLVTFFMLVTDRDILIADYCVKSFSLLSGLDFKLVVFCNWVTSANRAKYFDKWRESHPFVEILEPEWMTEERRPSGVSAYGYGVEGPYERCEVPWDRELPNIKSRYYATVDADFEILYPEFMHRLLEQLENSATMGFIGTDITNESYFTDHEHPGKNIQHSVINTWCCLYKRETLDCKVSHLYYREKSPVEGISYNVWDSSGLKQLALKYIHGYQGLNMQSGFHMHFIHYGAFSKNKHLSEMNIALWRQLIILKKIGYPSVLEPNIYSRYQADLLRLLTQIGIRAASAKNVSELASMAYNKLFSHVDKSNPYKNDWGSLQKLS